MTRAASVGDKNGYNSKIFRGMRTVGSMPISNAMPQIAKNKSRDFAIAQRELQRGSLKGGHGELVEHELGLLGEFGHKFEPRCAAQEPRFHRGWVVHALPCHRHPGLESAHPVNWQR